MATSNLTEENWWVPIKYSGVEAVRGSEALQTLNDLWSQKNI